MAAAATLADRPEFMPPPTRGLLRALGLAILAHGLLVAALTWGVRWKRDAEQAVVQAELWASVPVQAAPAPVTPPPAPPAVEPPRPPVETAPVPKPDIAVERERERQRRLKAEQVQREQQRQAEQRRAQEARERDKAQAERQRAQAQREQAQRDQQEAARVEAQRKANLARIAGLAGATGGPTATGTAVQSAGPSASYAGRVIARIKPNIVFADNPAGNPTTLVEVRTAPDGTIVGRRLLKSSGHRGWDEAVMKALEKTETLPRDTDGRVPPVLEISFRVHD